MCKDWRGTPSADGFLSRADRLAGSPARSGAHVARAKREVATIPWYAPGRLAAGRGEAGRGQIYISIIRIKFKSDETISKLIICLF